MDSLEIITTFRPNQSTDMTPDASPPPAPPRTTAPEASPAKARRSALLPAILALVLPVGAFVLSWLYAGKIPMAVPKAEWGTWFVIGALMSAGGLAGVVFAVRALMRGGYRSVAVAGLVLSLVVVLVAWAGVFA